MKKLLLLALALAPGLAFGQAYSNSVTQNSPGNYGRPVNYPQVLVCTSDDFNVPCVSRAQTFTDDTLTTLCTTSGTSGQLIGNPTSGPGCNNPGIGDVNGNFTIYVASGEYMLCTYSGTWLCQQFTLGTGGGIAATQCAGAINGAMAGWLTPQNLGCDNNITTDFQGNLKLQTVQALAPYDGLLNLNTYSTGIDAPFAPAAGEVDWEAPIVAPPTSFRIRVPNTIPTVGQLPVVASISTNTNGSNGTHVNLGWLTSNTPSTYRTCTLIYGSDDGTTLVNADLGPQGRQCILPYNATIVQVEVAADTGTPSIMLADNHQGTDTNILSGALTTAASGGVACATASGGLAFDGVTTCGATLQNTSAVQGDYLEAVSGTASSAHRMSIFITFTQPNFTFGGTVTSIGMTVNGGTSSGIFTAPASPVVSAGNLNLGIAGTSGGVACFTTGTVLSSSALLTASLPVIGGGAGVCPSVGTVTGNTTKFATSTGSLTTNDCAKWDANGNIVDAGAGCSAGGGGTVLQYECPNNGAGTTVNTLTKTAGTACQIVNTGSSFNLTWFAGITISGAGTTGNALIQHRGQAQCVFDNGITQGDYFTWSGSVNGDCHDMGGRTSAFAGNFALGTVVSPTNASAGTYTVDISVPSGQDSTNSETATYPLMGIRSPFLMPSSFHNNSLMTGGSNYSDEPLCVVNSNGNFACHRTDSSGDFIIAPNAGAAGGGGPGGAQTNVISGFFTTVDSQGTTSGSVTFDMSTGMIHTVTASGNITIANPSNLKAGQIFILQLCENGTGSFTWSWGTEFINHPSPSTTASSCSTPVAPTNFLFYAIDSTHIYTASSF